MKPAKFDRLRTPVLPAESTVKPARFFRIWATKTPEASTVKPAKFDRLRTPVLPAESTVKELPVFLKAFDVIVPEISRLPSASVNSPEEPEPEENGTPFKNIPVEPVRRIFPAASTLKPPDRLAKVWATKTPEASTVKVLPVFLKAFDVIVPEISRFPNASVKSPEEPEENGTPFKNIPVDPVRRIFPAESTRKPPVRLAKVWATKTPEASTVKVLLVFLKVFDVIAPEISRFPNASVERPEEPEENGTPFKNIPVDPVRRIFPAESTLKPPD